MRSLGKSGVEVSAVGLGCNAFGGRISVAESRKVIHKALDLGVTLFDTASTYGNRYGVAGGSELCLGEVLGARRKDVVLATKFGTQSAKHASIPVEGASRCEIMHAVEASLERLRTDWIDLYQLHHPDPRTPIEETLRALDDLVRQGKIRFIGCSNTPAWRLVDADWTARHFSLAPFVTCQAEYSLLSRGIERELLPVMQKIGVGLLPYYPLAGGLLSGKYTRERMPADTRFASEQRLAKKYLNDANWGATERLQAYCRDNACTLLEVAFAWLLAHPTVSSVIAGATRPEQVEANVKAGSRMLNVTQVAQIDAALVREALQPALSA